MKILPALSFMAMAMSPLAAATIDLPEYGFEIEALDAKPGSQPETALITFLPLSDGFSPNINIQIQPYAGTIRDYAELSRGQFQQMKWSLVSEKSMGDAEWVAEYKGDMQGNALHFYARAIAREGKIYLVTASAKESQWTTVGETLRRHVESFKLK